MLNFSGKVDTSRIRILGGAKLLWNFCGDESSWDMIYGILGSVWEDVEMVLWDTQKVTCEVLGVRS